MSETKLPNGQTLHRFTTSADGREWACMAYDHGPMCRLCQPVDGVLAACLENVMDGMMEPRQKPDGTFQFRVTDAGNERVRHWTTRHDYECERPPGMSHSDCTCWCHGTDDEEPTRG